MKNPSRPKKPTKPAPIADKEKTDGERAEPNATQLEEIRRRVEAKNLARYPEHEPRLVAEIASRLLYGGKDFASAAKNALSLLDACESAMKSRRAVREAHNTGEMRNQDVPANLPYNDGIKYITVQTRTDRAAKDFAAFLPYFLADRRNRGKIELRKFTKPEMAQEIARYQAEGFEQDSLAAGKRLFQLWSKIPKNSR